MTQVIEAMEGMTFGCDPELFVVDSDGKTVCADGLIPGTKDEPFKVDCGAVQVDGVAAEFNINPARTFEEFNHNIRTVVGELKSLLPKGYNLSASPSNRFSDEDWAQVPEHAKVLGCSPDFNAWTGGVNKVADFTEVPVRFTGGHLHVGWTEDVDTTDLQHISSCRDLVKQFDWYLGAWSARKNSGDVGERERRNAYGRAGAMRFKPYGVEYRVLSSFWVERGEDRLEVWNRMQKAIWDMREQYMPDFGDAFCMNTTLINSINESKADSAMSRKFKFPVVSL